jgi:hypothetical protein
VHVRVVRFTDVDPQRVEAIVERINQSDGPPEGAPASGVQVLLDADQKTAVVLQMFNSADDMAEGEKVFAAMDPGETPGTRASVDRCELKVEMHA